MADPRSRIEVVELKPDGAADEVAPGRKVTLHFSLALPDGELIDSCFDKPPVSFTIGDGNMLPGFEKALYGLKAGQERECLLAPEQAFGLRNEDNVQYYPRYRFPADLELREGLLIDFAGSGSYSQAGVVRCFDSARVQIDFNHPLAGRSILFKAHVVSVG